MATLPPEQPVLPPEGFDIPFLLGEMDRLHKFGNSMYMLLFRLSSLLGVPYGHFSIKIDLSDYFKITSGRPKFSVEMNQRISDGFVVEVSFTTEDYAKFWTALSNVYALVQAYVDMRDPRSNAREV